MDSSTSSSYHMPSTSTNSSSSSSSTTSSSTPASTPSSSSYSSQPYQSYNNQQLSYESNISNTNSYNNPNNNYLNNFSSYNTSLTGLNTNSLPSISSSSCSSSASSPSSSSPLTSTATTNSHLIPAQNDLYSNSSSSSILNQQKTTNKSDQTNYNQFSTMDQSYYYNNYQATNNQPYWNMNNNNSSNYNTLNFDPNYQNSQIYSDYDTNLNSNSHYSTNQPGYSFFDQNNQYNWPQSSNNFVLNQPTTFNSLSNSPSYSDSYQTKIKSENFNTSNSNDLSYSQSNPHQQSTLDCQNTFKTKTKSKLTDSTIPNKLAKSSVTKRYKIKEEPKNLYLTSSQICNVCEKTFESSMVCNQTPQTCPDCKSFFKKYARKSTRPVLCNLQHVNNQLFDIDCESCKYDKCVQVGLCLSKLKPLLGSNSSSNESNNNKIDIDNQNIFDNLSLEANISNSSASTSSDAQFSNNYNLNFNQLISFIIKEIENKKILIRTANSELKLKEHLTDMSKNLINLFQMQNQSYKLDTNNNSLVCDRPANMNKSLHDKLRRPLLIAYSYLIDHNNDYKSGILLLLSCDLSHYELRLLNQLQKIYSAKEQATNFIGYTGNNLYAYNNQAQQQDQMYYQTSNNYYQQSFGQNANTFDAPTNELNELKMLHFLLLLFSSFLNIDQFMQISSSPVNLNLSNQFDATYCQKLILQLIDSVCKDKLIKTKILLSVSDLELI